jgi:hypothetical protein
MGQKVDNLISILMNKNIALMLWKNVKWKRIMREWHDITKEEGEGVTYILGGGVDVNHRLKKEIRWLWYDL